MAVSVIDRSTADRLASTGKSTELPLNRTFFDYLGTTNCQLRCALNQEINGQVLHRDAQLSRRERAAARRRLKDSQPDWFTAAEIASSASAGCQSCSALTSIFRHAFAMHGDELCDVFKYSYTHDLSLKRRPLFSDDSSSEVVQVFQPLGSGKQLMHIPSSQFLYDVDTSLSRLKRWLDDCTKNHTSCAQAGPQEDEASRPTRLLDLRPYDESKQPTVRLIKTEPSTAYRYACLSHRWDDLVSDCRTIEQNVEQHQLAVDEQCLPMNFRDAIIIARFLDIRYLWIDSLCIIQGGKDLDIELAKMGSIYQNASLTIAAVSSSDSSGGCFRKIGPDIPLLLCNGNSESCVLGLRVLDRKAPPQAKSNVPYRYPLLERAWVYQERLLSRRFLQCTSGEFTFECAEQSVCECESFIAPHPAERIARKTEFINRWRSAMQVPFESVKLMGTENHLQDRRESALQHWRFIITAYMYLKLSYSQDVLPAISGCAQFYAQRFSLTYVAGMWKERLANSLMWYVRPLVTDSQSKSSAIRPKKRSLDSTAPTWSWASLGMGQTVEVYYTQGSRAVFKETLKEVCCEPLAAENPYGRLQSAYLILDTILYPWYLRAFCQEAALTIEDSRRRVMMDLHINRGELTGTCTTEVKSLRLEEGNVQVFYDAPIIRDELELKSFTYCTRNPPHYCWLAKIYLLPALRQTDPSKKVLDVFLMLIKANSSDVDAPGECYKRIGLVVVGRQENGTKSWDDMISQVIQPYQQRIRLI